MKFGSRGRPLRAGARRSPCGERGLKFRELLKEAVTRRRSPCGERGLKYLFYQRVEVWRRRSPCGERGLK